MWLEVNSISICFLISKEIKKEKFKENSTLTYLIIQVVGSLIIIIGGLQNREIYTQLMIAGVILKIGAWPLHTWFIKIISLIKIKWNSLLIIITIQKIPAIYLLTILNIKNSHISFIVCVSVISTLIPLRNISENSRIKEIIALSSLRINGWLIVSTIISIEVTSMFATFYFITIWLSLKILRSQEIKNFITEGKFWKYCLIISNIGGIPPFTIFWRKAILVKKMIQFNSFKEILIIIIISSGVLLYFYIVSLNTNIIESPKKTQFVRKKIITKKIARIILIPSLIACLAFFLLDYTLEIYFDSINY